jgi:arylsulfatase
MAGEFLFHDPENPNEKIDEQISTHGSIADQLRQRGYSTGAFSPNPHASRFYGLDSGFDSFEDFLETSDRREVFRTFLDRLRSGDLVEGLRLTANLSGYSIPGFGNQSIPLRAYKSDVVDWARNAEEPWFLWVFMLEPHSPFRPTRSYRQISFPRMLWLNLVWSNLFDRDPSEDELDVLRDLYSDAVRMTADSIGQFYRELQEMDPVVVLHSDHGEAFGEHGTFGHDEALFEENVRVPLAILNIPTTGTVESPISLTEVPALVRDIADNGDVDPDDYTFDTAVSRVPAHSVAVRSETEKLVCGDWTRSYDLETDSSENSPVENPSLRESTGLKRFVTHQTERDTLSNVVSEPETHSEL